jgi:hypothetical protein
MDFAKESQSIFTGNQLFAKQKKEPIPVVLAGHISYP